MELLKRNIHMDCQKCKASTQLSLEEDVNISDTRPDAGKLIMDRGNVVIEECKVTDDHVNVKGKLEFQLLYLVDGKGNDIAGMNGAIPFEELIYMEGVKSTDSVSVDWEIEDMTSGLINSRKISVQALLCLTAVCEEIKEEEIAIDLVSNEPVEFRKKTLEMAAMLVRRNDIFRIKEEVEIPGSFPNIFSMIYSEAMPLSVEFKVLTDKIALQGEMRIFFLYRGEGEEEEICHYETIVPFSGSVECMGVSEGMIPEISYRAETKEVAVRPDFDGEERVVTFELCLNMDIRIFEEENVDILADVYGVASEVSVSEREARFHRLLARCNGKMKVSEHFQTNEDAQIVRILHTGSDLQIEETHVIPGGVEIIGNIGLKILYECAKEEKYGMLKENIPFRYELPAENVVDGSICSLQPGIDQITVSVIDGEEIDVKCVLLFRANVYQEWTEKIVEQIKITELDMQKMSELPGIAVYMVREGESLWDIGKRYYVPIANLMQTNQLNSEEVRCGDKILIVKSS